MLQKDETFFTSVGCMDGRVQEPVASFGRQKFGVQHADTITEAGLVGVLAKENLDNRLLRSLKEKINISLGKHHSKGIIVHGHQDCAGNPVDDEVHKKDILTAAKKIRELVKDAVSLFPVFVKKSGEEWIVETLVDLI